MPTQTTSFISRETEQKHILGHLAHAQHRLVTLTGPGGIGKTRLAIQASYRAIEQHLFPDGIFFVDLVGIDSGSFLAATIASAIGCPIQGLEHVEQQLIAHLARRKLLLLLDNFEHLIETGIALIDQILHTAPEVHVLVTSRESLDMIEEWLIEVRGLSYPTSNDIADEREYDAVRMFIDRAQQVLPEFNPSVGSEERQAIYQICRIVEGMPLGIELAATWARLLPCAQIAREIQFSFNFLSKAQRNRPQRHSGLRAMFDYSWRLLRPDQQQTLAQLSVFRGAFTREAVIAVTQTDLTTLSALMDKSLLRRDKEGMYSIHELLRQFAFEQLKNDPMIEHSVRDRHASHYGLLVAQQAQRWDGAQMAEACRTIQAEIDNVRDGWLWASSHQNLPAIQLYLESLFDFYVSMNWYQEGKDLFEQAIASLENNPQESLGLVRAQIYARHARFCQDLGMFKQAEHSHDQSMALLRQFPNASELAFAYEQAGLAKYYQGDTLHAIELLRISLEHAQHIRDEARKAHILMSYAAAQINLNNLDTAEQVLQESKDIYHRIQKRWGTAYSMRFLAICAHKRGNFDKARSLHQHSLMLFQEIGLATGMAVELSSLGELSLQQQHYEDAYRSYRQALNFARDTHSMPVVLRVLLGVVQVLATPDEARNWAQEKPEGLLLLAFIMQHPAATNDQRDLARNILIAHAATLPPEQITSLQQQASKLDLAQVADIIAALAPPGTYDNTI